MPPMTTPGLRLVEDKPNHATEMPPSNKADALKEATITEPSSELAEGKRNHITKIPLLDQANAQEEVTITKPSREQAGGKPDHHTEMLPSDQTGAQKEATITGSPQETVDDQLKSSTPTTSDEDASGSIPAEQTAKEAVDPNSNSTLQTTKDLAGCGTVDGGGDTEDPTADSTDEKVDSEPTQKTKRGNSDKDSSRGELSDNDSQDSDDVEHEISEEEYLVHTAEGQRLCKQVAPKRIKQLGQYFRTVEYRMTFLEKELKKLRGDNLESKPKGDKDEMPEPPKVVPSIRRMNWADYKAHPQDASELGIPEVSQRSTWEGLKVRLNVQKKGETNFAKASGDQHDATAGATSKHQHHVLEVLIEDPGTKRRRQVRKHTDDENATKISGRNAKTQQKSDSITAQTSKTTLQCPERLRICSRPVLRMLHDIFEPDNPESYGSHMVFLRPFKALVLYETEIRVALINLEKKWQSKGQISSSEKTSEGKSETTDKDPAADAVVKTDSLEALEHLRLLVEFLDNDLRSTFELRKQLKAKEARPIAFADLWHLYEHGQEVRTPEKKLQIFKVARFAGGRDLLSESMPSFRDYRSVPVSCIKREESNGAFFVECYRYDFNGTQYGPVNNMFEIRRYEGLRDIKSLQVYPLRFDHDHQKERAHLVHRGEKFMALARVNETAHKTYCGLSLDEHAEEIESPIIVDFQLAITKGNIRSSKIGFQSTLNYDPRELCETPDHCGFKECGIWEVIFYDYWFDGTVSDRFLADQKPHLAPVENPEELGEDERALLPYSVHGFVLRSRKWRTFNIDELEDIKYSSGFDDLVLPPGHKDTVEALVNRHSRGTETTSSRAENQTSMDLVTGKGKGLIILLHGAPGVGKTSTAECVANKTDRPLFPITCGDLGESAIEVEESLERNFSLAHKWGCVLLLDEADVFLTLRNQTDLRRNAVVSVFLRTLEYYSGILFLTTNRVGALDPAFKSRIHISLYYPKLGRKASSEIWRNHIEKARGYFEKKGGKYSLRKREIIEFSKQHHKNLKDQKAEPWNGRQIRNAFQTAIALAEHEAYLNGGKPELTERHFEKVAKASSDFDWYLKMTHGRSESQLAEASRIRTDDPEKAAKKMAAIAQLQRPRGQPKSEDDSSDTDSSEQDSSDADDVSSSEDRPTPKANKKTKKKKQRVLSEDETRPKKAKKGREKQESTSEEEAPIPKKNKKGKAKHDSASEDEAPSTKKTKKDKERNKKKKEPSSDEEQDSSDEEKDIKESGKEKKGKGKEKEKAKSTSKSFN